MCGPQRRSINSMIGQSLILTKKEVRTSHARDRPRLFYPAHTGRTAQPVVLGR